MKHGKESEGKHLITETPALTGMQEMRSVTSKVSYSVCKLLKTVKLLFNLFFFCFSRSSSPVRSANQAKSEAHDKAMAERRVVYVGGIPRKYTPSDLRKRFDAFGEIEDASVHFRHNRCLRVPLC